MINKNSQLVFILFQDTPPAGWLHWLLSDMILVYCLFIETLHNSKVSRVSCILSYLDISLNIRFGFYKRQSEKHFRLRIHSALKITNYVVQSRIEGDSSASAYFNFWALIGRKYGSEVAMIP